MLIYTTVDELENRGVAYRQGTNFVVNGRRFTKIQSFSKRMREAAIGLYHQSEQLCLFVESPDYITICRQR